MKTSDQIGDLAKALSLAQGKMSHAIKDSTNPFFKSKYADLESVIDAAKKPLEENGLSVSQGGDYYHDQWVIVTKLSHSSGQWIETYCPILANKQDAQGFGSGMTYARRYSYAAIIGITQSDDDAAAAVQSTQKETKKPLHQPKQIEEKKPTPINYAQQSSNPGAYVIPFGKEIKGKTLDQVDDAKLRGLAGWLLDKAKAEGKEVTGSGKLYLEKLEEWFKYKNANQANKNEPPDFSFDDEFNQ
jgi:hypothetical protein